LVTALLGAYTENDVIVLHGCVITGTTPKAITAGAVFYNGQVYKVAAATGITASGTWIFAIKSDVNPYQVEFKGGSGVTTGFIANWDDVIRFNQTVTHAEVFVDTTVEDIDEMLDATVLCTAHIRGNILHLSGVLQILISDATALNAVVSPVTIVFDLADGYHNNNTNYIGSCAGSLRGGYSVSGYILPGDGVEVGDVAEGMLRFVLNFGGTTSNSDFIELGFSATYELKI